MNTRPRLRLTPLLIVAGLAFAGPSSQASESLRFFTRHSCRNIQLSCDLGKLPALPEIVLVGIGEKDNSTLSRIMGNTLLVAAKGNLIELFTEVSTLGPAFNWSKDRKFLGRVRLPNSSSIRAIDSPIYWAVLSAYQYLAAELFSESMDDRFISLVVLIDANPLFRGAYEQMRQSPIHTAAISKVDAILEKLSNLTGTSLENFEIRREIGRLELGVAKEDRQRFALDLNTHVLQIAQSTFPKEFEGISLPFLNTAVDAIKFGMMPGEGHLKPSVYHEILIHRRNTAMATQIAQRLCEPKLPKAPMVILTGSAHSEGIGSILSCLSDNQLKFETFELEDPSQVAELSGYLEQRIRRGR